MDGGIDRQRLDLLFSADHGMVRAPLATTARQMRQEAPRSPSKKNQVGGRVDGGFGANFLAAIEPRRGIDIDAVLSRRLASGWATNVS
jgi:hypothetical protein